MGRPIKTAKLVGGTPSDTGYTNLLGLGVVAGEIDGPTDVPTISCAFNLNGAVLSGWIVRQKGARKFLVTDGTFTGICVLANTATPAIGEMSIAITTATAGGKFLAKLNDTFGTAFDGVSYHLTFGGANQTPPAGSTFEIAEVAST